jgi:hypothetical protein
MKREFVNNSSQAERIAQLHNDRLRQREPTTFFQMARVAEELEAQGRHAIDRAAVEYPRLPAASPWAAARSSRARTANGLRHRRSTACR